MGQKGKAALVKGSHLQSSDPVGMIKTSSKHETKNYGLIERLLPKKE